MFQLIVAVVAVVIVGLLALATIFYGGSVFQDSGEKGRFDGYVNQGTQIQAGLKLQQIDTGSAQIGTSTQQFTALESQNYLTSKPQGDWIIDNQVIYKPLTDTAQCMRFNKYSGKDVTDTTLVGTGGVTVQSSQGCPPCGDTTFAAYPACNSDTVATDADAQ